MDEALRELALAADLLTTAGQRFLTERDCRAWETCIALSSAVERMVTTKTALLQAQRAAVGAARAVSGAPWPHVDPGECAACAAPLLVGGTCPDCGV